MIVYVDKKLQGFQGNLFDNIALSTYFYDKSSLIRQFKCFLRNREESIRLEKSGKEKICFDFSSAINLPQDFLSSRFSRIRLFISELVCHSDDLLSREIFYMWEYILGIDPYSESLSKYTESFGLNLDFYDREKGPIVLQNLKRILDFEIRKEFELKNKHSWHINELVLDEISSEELEEVLSFRRTGKIKKSSFTRKSEQYANAVIYRILSFLKGFKYPSHRNSSVFSPLDPEGEVIFSGENGGVYGLPESNFSCSDEDLIVIMNEKLYFDLCRYRDLEYLGFSILTLKSIPYECIKMGSKYRYNKTVLDNKVYLNMAEKDTKMEFLYRQFLDFFIDQKVPFLSLKVFGLKESLSLD